MDNAGFQIHRRIDSAVDEDRFIVGSVEDGIVIAEKLIPLCRFVGDCESIRPTRRQVVSNNNVFQRQRNGWNEVEEVESVESREYCQDRDDHCTLVTSEAGYR